MQKIYLNRLADWRFTAQKKVWNGICTMWHGWIIEHRMEFIDSFSLSHSLRTSINLNIFASFAHCHYLRTFFDFSIVNFIAIFAYNFYINRKRFGIVAIHSFNLIQSNLLSVSADKTKKQQEQNKWTQRIREVHRTSICL